MRIVWLWLLASGVALAGGAPSVYVVGNVTKLSPGDEGILVLDQGKAVFRSGKTVLPIPYADMRNVELGTRLNPPSDVPLYKVWQLHKRFLDRPMHQMLTVEFVDKDGEHQTMTLEMDESAAAETLTALEIKQGKRRRATNGEAWWGDSLWKTNKNHNTVSPETLGNPPPPPPPPPAP
jgi:hypothetical protein